MKGRRDSGLREAVGEGREVATHYRLDVGIESGDCGALILPESRIHLAGERHLQIRILRACDFTHPTLVLRIEKREQKAHRDALGSRRNELIESRDHGVLVEGGDDLSRRPDAFPYPEAHFARSEEHRSLGVEADFVHLPPHLATDLQDVPETLRRDDPEPAALAFQHRVGGDGRAVGKLGDRAGLHSLRDHQAVRCQKHRISGVGGSARHLEHDGRLALANTDYVGESAAYVHSDAPGCRGSVHARSFSTARCRICVRYMVHSFPKSGSRQGGVIAAGAVSRGMPEVVQDAPGSGPRAVRSRTCRTASRYVFPGARLRFSPTATACKAVSKGITMSGRRSARA